MQNALAYRGSFIINILSSFIFIMALFYLWKAIFVGHTELAGYSWEEMKAYLLIVFLSNTLLTWYSEGLISGKILDGSVAMDLLKPLDFQKARFAETMGISVFESWISAVLICIFLILFAGIILPSKLLIWFLFIISLLASLVIKFGIIYIAGLLCFWTTSSLGIVWARMAITNLFSGALIPLAFFPQWLKELALILPFQGIVHTPASIYLEQVQYEEAFKMLGLQLFWVFALWIAGKLLWIWAVRKVTIHGG
jgi:ABC-2 type transport system permease protein